MHAAADGVALGAATLVDKAEIEFIIFMAIMLHKAPAAFGLTSFLLHEVRDEGVFVTLREIALNVDLSYCGPSFM